MAIPAGLAQAGWGQGRRGGTPTTSCQQPASTPHPGQQAGRLPRRQAQPVWPQSRQQCLAAQAGGCCRRRRRILAALVPRPQLAQQRRSLAPSSGGGPAVLRALSQPGAVGAAGVQAQLVEPSAWRQAMREGSPWEGVPRQLLHSRPEQCRERGDAGGRFLGCGARAQIALCDQWRAQLIPCLRMRRFSPAMGGRTCRAAAAAAARAHSSAWPRQSRCALKCLFEQYQKQAHPGHVRNARDALQVSPQTAHSRGSSAISMHGMLASQCAIS